MEGEEEKYEEQETLRLGRPRPAQLYRPWEAFRPQRSLIDDPFLMLRSNLGSWQCQRKT
jgi:hypothetical protein